MAKSFIGLEINPKSIRVAEIEKKGTKKTLKAVGEISIPANSVPIISEAASDTLSLYIKKLIQDSGIKSRLVVGSYPSDMVSIDIVNLPPMPYGELSEAMKWQLGKYVSGYPEKRDAFWDVLEKDQGYKVIVMGTEKSVIPKYINLLKKSGLNPFFLEIEPIALTKSLVKTQENFVILHIDPNFSSFTLVDKGKLSITRSLKIGTSKLVDAINRELKDSNRSEKLLYEFGLIKSKNNNIYNKIEPVFNQISAELKRTIGFFEDQTKREVKKVFLSGDGAVIPDIDNYFIKETSRESVLANPWLDLDFSSSVDQSQLVPLGPKFAVAVGLALLNC